MFYEIDQYQWTLQINDKQFKQSRAAVDGVDVVQFKVFTTVKAPINICLECATNFEVRKTWDDVLYDFRVFE
jgi:hypothetical protein